MYNVFSTSPFGGGPVKWNYSEAHTHTYTYNDYKYKYINKKNSYMHIVGKQMWRRKQKTTACGALTARVDATDSDCITIIHLYAHIRSVAYLHIYACMYVCHFLHLNFFLALFSQILHNIPATLESLHICSICQFIWFPLAPTFSKWCSVPRFRQFRTPKGERE